MLMTGLDEVTVTHYNLISDRDWHQLSACISLATKEAHGNVTEGQEGISEPAERWQEALTLETWGILSSEVKWEILVKIRQFSARLCTDLVHCFIQHPSEAKTPLLLLELDVNIRDVQSQVRQIRRQLGDPWPILQEELYKRKDSN